MTFFIIFVNKPRIDMEPAFSYRIENNEYVLYQNDTCIVTPGGNTVSTTNEDLAAGLVKAIEQGEHYRDAKSLLCFHFTYLDSKKDEEEIMQEPIEIPFEELMNDPYLMFRQDSPIRQVIAQYFCDGIPAYLSKLPFHKKLAYFTMACGCESKMLPYYIMFDVVGQEDVEGCREAFFEDLLEYLYDFFATRKEAKAFLKKITPVIDTFIKYMSYDEV